jgi:hypothetical protein
MRRLPSLIYFVLILFSIVCGIINPFSGGVYVWKESLDKASEELRYRKFIIDQYKEEICTKIGDFNDIFVRNRIKKQVARLAQQVEVMSKNKIHGEELRQSNQGGRLSLE